MRDKRKVRYADEAGDKLTHEIPREPSEDRERRGMRIRDARKDVPRKPGESRSQWKSRVLTHKLNIDAKK